MDIPQNQPDVSLFIVIAMLLVGCVFLLLLLAAVYFVGRHWFKAFLSGTPISIFQVIGMVFRGTDVSNVIKQGVAANQAGHPIKWIELERAAVEGVDLESVTKAYCISRENGKHYSMKELVDAARESRLDKLLGH